MDWKKAKNYTIIFLLILNIVLLGLNIIKLNKYKLSQGQKKAITSVLNRSNMTVECDIPVFFRPLPQLTLKSSGYDAIELQNIFFDSVNDIKRTEEFGNTIFLSGERTLTISGNNAFYENSEGTEGFELNEKNAEAAVEKYLKAIKNRFDSVKLSQSIINDDCIILIYDQYFYNMPVFNNSIVFTVYDGGEVSCDFSYFSPVQMTGEKTDICSADEALFVFYKGIKDMTDGNNPIKIVKMELGYFTEEYMETNTSLTAVPHYRICVEGEEKPYYINAYNSSMLFE